MSACRDVYLTYKQFEAVEEFLRILQLCAPVTSASCSPRVVLSRPLNGPVAICYLTELKTVLSANSSSLIRLLRLLRDWLGGDEYGSDPTPKVCLIASHLKTRPRLLYDLNALLPTGYRIECPIDVAQVDYFLFISHTSAQIYSTSSSHFQVPAPSSAQELRRFISFNPNHQVELTSHENSSWLTCIAQLLQLELDNLSISPNYRRDVFRCLKHLSTINILPPSLIINNVTYEKGNPLSGGAFSDIFMGKLGSKYVALKVLRMFSTPPESHKKVYKDFCREVLIWRQLDHPNVLPFLGASEKLFDPRFCLISPWMSNGNIVEYLKRHPDHDRLSAICEIVDGIEYLHHLDPPVTHKDIKGANILVNDARVCCLADFGIASIVELQSQLRMSAPLEGSLCWLAPELMQPDRFPPQGAGLPGDVFALACTIFEIYTGMPPHANLKNGAAVILAIHLAQRPTLPPNGYWTTQEEQVWSLVEICWSQQASDRPTIRDIQRELKKIATSLYRESLSSPSLSPYDQLDNPLRQLLDDKRGLADVVTWLDNELDFEIENQSVITRKRLVATGSSSERAANRKTSVFGEERTSAGGPLQLLNFTNVRVVQGLPTPDTPTSRFQLPGPQRDLPHDQGSPSSKPGFDAMEEAEVRPMVPDVLQSKSGRCHPASVVGVIPGSLASRNMCSLLTPPGTPSFHRARHTKSPVNKGRPRSPFLVPRTGSPHRTPESAQAGSARSKASWPELMTPPNTPLVNSTFALAQLGLPGRVTPELESLSFDSGTESRPGTPLMLVVRRMAREGYPVQPLPAVPPFRPSKRRARASGLRIETTVVVEDDVVLI